MPIVTAIVGAVVTAGAFLASNWRQRRETIDTRVERAVKGQIGDRFMDFLEVGERTAKEMRVLSENASAMAEEVTHRAHSQLQALERGVQLQVELQSLLSRAEHIVPDLDKVAAASPAALVGELRDPRIELPRASALIQQLSTSQSASSRQLEAAGDRARELLEDELLARQLYRLAVDRNPTNTSARAELLGLDLEVDSDRADAALEGLRQLVRDHPNDTNPLAKLLNYYIQRDRYADLEHEVRGLLTVYPEKATLWRNLALALENTGAAEDEVDEAYGRAIAISTGTSADADFVNAAKSYVRWLAAKRRFSDADAVLRDGLSRMPSASELFLASYRLEMARGDFDKARRSLEVMASMGGPRERASIAQLMTGLDGIRYILESDQPPADPSVLIAQDRDEAEPLLGGLDGAVRPESGDDLVMR